MNSQTIKQSDGGGTPLGVLLVNLGTPDSPSVADVRRYLREFLWDPRVVELARPVWWLVLNLVILTTRPQRSAKAYAKVWTDAGSPLMVISRKQHPAYISALADSVRRYWSVHGEPDKLLLSFHGIPQAYVDAGDPYASQCYKTAELLVAALELPVDRWQLSFQSRLGPKQWLQPYTDHTLEALAAEGVHNVHVVCPGFSVDCLETLEEVAMENRNIFLAAGGERYGYIECLNEHASHIQLFSGLVAQHTRGWDDG